jgi:hypothetical protein
MLNIFKLLFKGRVVGQQGYLHHIHLQNRCLYLRKTGINIYPNRLSHLPSFFKILLLLLNFFNFPFISFSNPLLFSSLFFLHVSSCAFNFFGLCKNSVSKIVLIVFVLSPLFFLSCSTKILFNHLLLSHPKKRPKKLLTILFHTN